ncbi:MAG: DUF2807 domain-containing protein [Pseudomonadota bacterium]
MRPVVIGAVFAAITAPYAMAHDDPSHDAIQPKIVATDTVMISGIDTVTIVIGDEPALTITERRGRTDDVEVKSTSEGLFIEAKDLGWFASRDFSATLTLPAISILDISGSFDAEMTGVNADTLQLTLAGSGDIIVSGRCGTLQLDTAGAMDVNAKGLVCERAEIDAAGASDIAVFAARALSVEGAGSTNVRYSGDPGKVTSDVAGLGKVEAAPKEASAEETSL